VTHLIDAIGPHLESDLGMPPTGMHDGQDTQRLGDLGRPPLLTRNDVHV
jgi:hypothetical protein